MMMMMKVMVAVVMSCSCHWYLLRPPHVLIITNSPGYSHYFSTPLFRVFFGVRPFYLLLFKGFYIACPAAAVCLPCNGSPGYCWRSPVCNVQFACFVAPPVSAGYFMHASGCSHPIPARAYRFATWQCADCCPAQQGEHNYAHN